MTRMAPVLSTPRRFRRLILICAVAIPLLLWAVFSTSARELYLGKNTQGTDLFIFGTKRMPTVRVASSLGPRVSCIGPRGRPLSESPDDQLHYEDLTAGKWHFSASKQPVPLRPTSNPMIAYPEPFFGSQQELGLDKTWLTAASRYGPYGYGEDEPTYNRSKVDWDSLDWGELQDDCNLKNAHRFPEPVSPTTTRVGDDVRFSIRSRSSRNPAPKWDEHPDTRRTALVLRTYQGFNYTAESMWSIRSLITEAALATGGEYAVFLLVNVHDKDMNIFKSSNKYEEALLEIPPELRSIAVLWDEHLLESWYNRIKDHDTMFQIYQPLQLFALHYPEYDHYWQLEMDQRFMGDAGKYLDAVAEFARNEPRKQAFERATYPFSERRWESYESMLYEVDEASKGQSRAWGPAPIPEIQPIGPVPPTAKPEDDDFGWGIGEDADLIVSSFCADVTSSHWVMSGWMRGDFSRGLDTPRWWCPPAIMRSSRSLLLEAHASQHQRGLALPSEAMLPSWALWHGLKLSYPPQPTYWRSLEGHRGMDGKIMGGNSVGGNGNGAPEPFTGVSPKASADGLSRADPQNNADDGLTWWWGSSWPKAIMDVWLSGNISAEDFPSILAEQDGRVYAPNFAMHPVKGGPQDQELEDLAASK